MEARQTHRTTEAAEPLALISWHHVDPPSSSSPLFHWTRRGQQGQVHGNETRSGIIFPPDSNRWSCRESNQTYKSR